MSSDFQDAFNAGVKAVPEPVIEKLGDDLVVLRGVSVNAQGGVSPFLQSLERLQPTPVSKRGKVDLFDTASFCEYVKVHATGGTRIFADIDKAILIAVLDHHAPAEASWGHHRVELITRLSQEWEDWNANDGVRKTQVDFAQFVEDHITEIAEPTGGALLEIIKRLEIKKDVIFESAVRLDNGQAQMVYRETIEDQGKGEFRIPHAFTLGLEPFEGADGFRLVAKVRYRLEGGRLQLWFDLIRPDRVLAEAFKTRIAEVEAGTGRMVLRGTAPPAVTPIV